MADYVITLKRLNATCDFGGFLKQALRDRLVCGLRDENIQIVHHKKLTFQVANETAVAMEMAYQSESAFRALLTATTPITVDSVHMITSASKQGERKTFRKMERIESFKKGECYRCGNDHEAQSCPYRKSVCHKCNKVGHLARKCHSGQKKQPHQRKQLVTFVSAEPEMGFTQCTPVMLVEQNPYKSMWNFVENLW